MYSEVRGSDRRSSGWRSKCWRRLAIALAVSSRWNLGGEIGIDAVRRHGAALSQEVIAFCGSVFDRGGAILAGPGGGRFVYEMRAEFDLFCKLSPLVPSPELAKSRPLKPVLADNADIIVVRDNAAGIYQGSGRRFTSDTQGQIAEHTFSYSEGVVRRIVQVACRIAEPRGREVAVVTKESGVPEVSSLWREVVQAWLESWASARTFSKSTTPRTRSSGMARDGCDRDAQPVR